jgi:hypothetical protein
MARKSGTKKLLQEVTVYDYVRQLRRKYDHRRGTRHLKEVAEHTTLYVEIGLEQLRPIPDSTVLFQNRTSFIKVTVLSGTPQLIRVSTNPTTYRIEASSCQSTPPLPASGTPMLTFTSSIHLPSRFPTTICMQSHVLCPLYDVNQHSSCHETSWQSPIAIPFATENKIIWFIVYIRNSARKPAKTRAITQQTAPHLALLINADHLHNEKVNSIRTAYVTG